MRQRVFLCISLICLLTTVWAGMAFCAPASLENRYYTARDRLNALQKDSKRNKFRQPWVELGETFDKLHAADPKHRLASTILYRAAKSYDGLARRSFNANDASEAIKRYVKVAEDYPTSVLADDALLDAATLQRDLLKDPAEARDTLERLLKHFPKGDMVPKAQTMLSTLPKTEGTSSGSSSAEVSGSSREDDDPDPAIPSATARLTRIIWDPQRTTTRLTIKLDRPVAWALFSQRPNAQKGQPARLILELPGTTPRKDLFGARINKGLLKGFRVDLQSDGTTQVRFDFTTFKRFAISVAKDGSSLVIDVTTNQRGLKQGKNIGSTIYSPQLASLAKSRATTDIVRQLGLSVRTIVIDAGHGGNDPGTMHNGIRESTLTLDMSKRLKAQLVKRGFTVRTTRDKDSRLSLGERVRFANAVKGDLFISIHVNANKNNKIAGFETYFLNFASSNSAARVAAVENSVGERNLGSLEGILADIVLGARTQESRHLANSVQRHTLRHLKREKFVTKDGGVRSAPFFVLMGSGMPGVLIELGYCTNPSEAKRLKRNDYLNALAAGIANGIAAYAEQLNP